MYTKTVQLYYPFEMLLNNKLNTIPSPPGTYVKCVLLKDVLLFKCISIDLIGCAFPLYFAVSEAIYGYFSWVLLQPRFVLSYPFNETHKMAINRLQKHKEKKETHNLSDISQLSKIL